MNTQKLQKKFPKVYTDFFSRCLTVVSAPHSFLWSGDFSGFYGGLTISNKIPLRIYVGLEQISSGRVEVASDAVAYYSERKGFEHFQLDNRLQRSLAKVSADLEGYRIHLLSEIPLGSSLGGLGAIAACLASLTEAQKRKTTKDQKNNISKQQYSNLFPKAWKIARELQTGRTMGATAYTSLCESKYPIVFYAEGEKYWAKSLDQLSKLGVDPVWPIDYGLIFSGKYVQGAAVIASAEEVKRLSIEREAKLDFKPLSRNPFWEDYINFLRQISIQNLYALTDLFSKGAHENSLRYFFNSLNQYQNLLHFLEISNPDIDKIYSDIHRMANIADNRVGSGAKITGVGKGGMVLFATSYGQYRSQLENQYDGQLVYTSWQDGTEEKGVLMEQSISNNHYSHFLDPSSYLLTIFCEDSVSRRLVSEKDLEDMDLDFIVDVYRHKIIMPGLSLSSKDIPSQKSTAIILKLLLESGTRELKNMDLPGSYATSRFDLQSKITNPITRLSGIDFEITGGMYENFVLKLKRLNKPVGVLEKL